jgi:hypothetical protein
MAEQVESLEETVKKKLREKYDVKLETDIKEWMEGLLDKKMDENLSFQENLKSGVLLCQYVPRTIMHHCYAQSYTSRKRTPKLKPINVCIKACDNTLYSSALVIIV